MNEDVQEQSKQILLKADAIREDLRELLRQRETLDGQIASRKEDLVTLLLEGTRVTFDAMRELCSLKEKTNE